MDHKKETPDRSKINMSDPRELKYWCKALEASEEQLAKAVDKVGNSAATVRKELAMSTKQADTAENGGTLSWTAKAPSASRSSKACLPSSKDE
jgi:3-oxoacyl-[acyl-carrier-protein] synthase III